MMYRYEDKKIDITIKNNFTFSINKIKKLYPLSILTMLFAIVLYILLNGTTVETINKLIKLIVLNITLLQTWVPSSVINTSLNGVAWYLSVTMFLYFVFPYLHGYINKRKICKLSIISLLILVLEIVMCIPFVKYFGSKSEEYVWFMYCFPVFRLGDFFIGCVLEKIYFSKNTNKIDSFKVSILEIISLILTVIIIFLSKIDFSNIILIAINNRTTLYIPLAVIWTYAFLIHFVITQYMAYLIFKLNLNINGIDKIFIILLELLLTIFLSIGYKGIHEKIIRGKLEKRK